MRRNRIRIGLVALAFALGPSVAAGQRFIRVGGEVGAGWRHPTDELGTFVETYNQVNDTALARPMELIGGVASPAWVARLHVGAMPWVMAVALGRGGYDVETSAGLNDGGARSVRVKVDDYVAALDLAYGRMVGPTLLYVGPSLITRVRETTLTGTRTLADGSSDAGDRTPASPLSGEFTGAVAQFALGAAIGAHRQIGGSTVLTFRAGATYPVGERAITVDSALERIDDLRFPVDVERFQVEGNVTTAGNAMRSGMAALEVEVSVGLAFGWAL